MTKTTKTPPRLAKKRQKHRERLAKQKIARIKKLWFPGSDVRGVHAPVPRSEEE